ncbi:MAG TPA: 4Fe-4S dicluster domain-containing protein [Candidatus Omnitrophota bacterium]|nr:4Fe-4S dicluster domain-containing protein [Candidatus Omnitrophota bacterium]
MTHVVTEPCIKCRYTDCVTVCPVDCFHEDKEMLVIDPEVCIDCGACIPECPVQAIYTEADVPDKWKSFIATNADKAKSLPTITEKKEPLAKDRPPK